MGSNLIWLVSLWKREFWTQRQARIQRRTPCEHKSRDGSDDKPRDTKDSQQTSRSWSRQNRLPLQPSKALRLWHFSLKLLDSRTVRQHTSCSTMFWQPQETNTSSLLCTSRCTSRQEGRELMAFIICFSSSRDHSPLLSVVWCLKTVISYILSSFLVMYSKRVNPVLITPWLSKSFLIY